MRLRTGLAEPITQIAARVLIEIDNVIDATVDGKIARAGRRDVSNASRRPTEQVLRTQIVAVAAQMRSKTNDLINLMLSPTLRVPAATVGSRVNWNGRAEFSVTIPSYGPPFPTVPLANIAGGVFNPTDRPFPLDGTMFVDNELPGRLAFATLSLLVRASALKALMKAFHGTL